MRTPPDGPSRSVVAHEPGSDPPSEKSRVSWFAMACWIVTTFSLLCLIGWLLGELERASREVVHLRREAAASLRSNAMVRAAHERCERDSVRIDAYVAVCRAYIARDARLLDCWEGADERGSAAVERACFRTWITDDTPFRMIPGRDASPDR